MKKTVCICGGGSQGHISAGVISSRGYTVNVLTRRPSDWDNKMIVEDLEGKQYIGKLNKVSSDPKDIIPESDIVFICLPGYAIEEKIIHIKDFLKKGAWVGSMFSGSGFFFSAIKVLKDQYGIFGLQRVPYTGRPKVYGHSATLKGYKASLTVAQLNISEKDELVQLIESFYGTPTILANHYLEVSLSNSNPILHPARMYALFSDWEENRFYDSIPLFYEEWDDHSSELWINCDKELMQIIGKLPITQNSIPKILDYYGCKDAQELTAKLRSIEPFKGVVPHLIETKQGYILDAQHRYFIEDIPYGLVLIKSIAEKVNVPTPTIDKILTWAQKVMNKEFIKNNKLEGKDVDRALFDSIEI